MARYNWYVREVIISGMDYTVGKLYNTPKGLLTLESIDATNELLRFKDKDNNFFNIDFIKFS
jgi:hypothetical protein